jgi:hypothetical protein
MLAVDRQLAALGADTTDVAALANAVTDVLVRGLGRSDR